MKFAVWNLPRIIMRHLKPHLGGSDSSWIFWCFAWNRLEKQGVDRTLLIHETGGVSRNIRKGLRSNVYTCVLERKVQVRIFLLAKTSSAIIQSINQSINRPNNQTITHSSIQSINQSINRPNNQTITHSSIQSINQSIERPRDKVRRDMRRRSQNFPITF